MTTWPYSIRGDRRYSVTGVYDVSNGYTKWTLPFDAQGISDIILGSDFGSNSGMHLPVWQTSGTEVRYPGNITDGPCILCRGYTMELTLTRPFVRDQNDIADADARLTVRQLAVIHHNTGAYDVKTAIENRPNQLTEFVNDETFSGAATYVNETHGFERAWHRGDPDLMTTTIENDTPRPTTVTSLEWTVDHAAREG